MFGHQRINFLNRVYRNWIIIHRTVSSYKSCSRGRWKWPAKFYDRLRPNVGRSMPPPQDRVAIHSPCWWVHKAVASQAETRQPLRALSATWSTTSRSHLDWNAHNALRDFTTRRNSSRTWKCTNTAIGVPSAIGGLRKKAIWKITSARIRVRSRTRVQNARAILRSAPTCGNTVWAAQASGGKPDGRRLTKT